MQTWDPQKPNEIASAIRSLTLLLFTQRSRVACHRVFLIITCLSSIIRLGRTTIYIYRYFRVCFVWIYQLMFAFAEEVLSKYGKWTTKNNMYEEIGLDSPIRSTIHCTKPRVYNRREKQLIEVKVIEIANSLRFCNMDNNTKQWTSRQSKTTNTSTKNHNIYVMYYYSIASCQLNSNNNKIYNSLWCITWSVWGNYTVHFIIDLKLFFIHFHCGNFVEGLRYYRLFDLWLQTQVFCLGHIYGWV